MTTPQQRPEDRHLLAAMAQELARCNDNRVFLLALVAQQSEQIAELQLVETQNTETHATPG